MSNALMQLVPVLDGSNYDVWAPLADAYISAQGHASVFTRTCPASGDAKTAWEDTNLKAKGIILLRVSASIAGKISSKDTAKEMWDYLKTEYGKPGLPVIYSHFKAALAVTIPNNAHPAPAINEMTARFDKLTAQSVNIDEFVRAMVLLTKLPQSMDYIVQSFYQKGQTTDVKFEEVRRAVIIHWEQRDTRRAPSGAAHKLSAIKRKGPDPVF